MQGVLKHAFGVSILVSGTLVARAQCLDNVPHAQGTWETLPYQMPINPISATMLRDGRILIVAGSENDANNNHGEPGPYRAAVWDPTGTDGSSFEIHHLEYDVFCSGTAQLPHGRVLIIGGTVNYSFPGENRSTFFDPVTNEFAQSQPMTDGRWYGTATTLGDGRIMALSGLNGAGNTTNRWEIYDLNTQVGWSSPIAEPFTPPLFPRTFLLPDGKVWYSGHGSGSSNSRGYLYTPSVSGGSWANSAVTTRSRSYGTAVLLPLLPPSYTPRVFAAGGGSSPGNRTTEVIDLSAQNPSWSSGPNMVTGRIEVGGVLLPNGNVLIHGGSVTNEAADGPGKKGELYDPATNSFSSAGTAAYSRLYHATSLLLPDARVVSMGSNPGDRGRYLGAIEVYTPPYLYDSNDKLITTERPAIVSAPTSPLNYGTGFSVGYTSTSAISSAVLIRPGSVTHAFDMDQRFIGLCGPSPQPACSGSGGTLNLTTPPSGNHAPPGYYMLFLLDAAGVPSHAAWIELSPYSGTPPNGVITTPSTEVWINAGQSVNFGTTTVADKYFWVFTGGTPATSTLKNPGNVTFNGAGEYYAVLTVGSSNGDTDRSPSTREIYVLPQSSDFELSVAQQSRTVTPGQSATFTVTVTPVKSFNGTVTLVADSEGGMPAGVSIGGFSPPTIGGGSGSSTLTVNTTSAALPYALSLSIHGTSGTRDGHAATTLLINLAPPEGLIATPSEGEVELSWLPVTGASGYEIRRSSDSGEATQSLDCTSGTGYTDTNVVNGTTYTYSVVATFAGGPNAGGASAPSAPVSATPACSTPTYSGALGGAKSGADLVWTWSSGGASAYDLIRGDLATLLATGGDFAAAIDALPAIESGCLANDTTSLSLIDPFGAPAVGQGIFTLLRPVTTACPAHGSADDGAASQIGDRDLEVEGASLSCP
jgi:galactose oxidase-like protein